MEGGVVCSNMAAFRDKGRVSPFLEQDPVVCCVGGGFGGAGGAVGGD